MLSGLPRSVYMKLHCAGGVAPSAVARIPPKEPDRKPGRVRESVDSTFRPSVDSGGLGDGKRFVGPFSGIRRTPLCDHLRRDAIYQVSRSLVDIGADGGLDQTCVPGPMKIA
jgi:hypothetical protein